MSYAGFQRYETPNLGAIASEAIDKGALMNLKKKGLEQESQLKKDAMLYKQQEASLKAQEDYAKEINSGEVGLNKAIIEAGAPPSKTGQEMMQSFANYSVKPAFTELSQMLSANKITPTQFNEEKNNLTYGVQALGETWKELGATYDKVKSTSGIGAAENWVLDTAMEDLLPTESNPKSLKLVKGATYIVDKNGEYINANALKNLSVLGKSKPIDFNKDAKENVIDLIPKNSIESTLSGGKTMTTINQAGQKGFTEALDRWVNRVMYDPMSEANAYVHYMGAGNVAFVKEGVTEKEKKDLALSMGYAEEDYAEAEKHFITTVIDNNRGIRIPKLTKDQKTELKETMIQSVDSMAAHSVGLSSPSITNFNAKFTSADQAATDQMNMVQGVIAGDPDWIERLRVDASNAGTIPAVDEVLGIDGKYHKTIEYNPSDRTLTVYYNRGKNGQTNAYSPDIIKLNKKELAEHAIPQIMKARETGSQISATKPTLYQGKR